MNAISRREFLLASAAGASIAVLPGKAAFAAAPYDLVVRGGRVIDPATGLDAIRDIAIAGGRIAAIAASIGVEAGDTLDARGKLVVPGLIDVHTHASRGASGPSRILKDGVTAWIDAGSAGADGIDEAIAVARSAPQLGRVLINIGRLGVQPDGDTLDLKRADVDAASRAIAANREFIVGVKARLSRDVAGENDIEVLTRTAAVAKAFSLPVMIHIGQSVSPLPKLLTLLKPGDIVTHMYAPAPNGILDDAGRVLPEVLAARRRGVLFDVGNGRTGHIRWDVVEAVMRQGFRPDTISTDWTIESPTNAVGDLPNCMSKLLRYGMSVPEVVACVTINASRTFPAFANLGTLKVGAPADVAILELRDGTFEYEDNYKGKITHSQRLFPTATIHRGKRV